jgi:Fe-S-cluster containining protein
VTTIRFPLPVLPKMPHMKCDTGCDACCGPVACNRDEYERVTGYAAAHGITPIRQGITCPYFQGGKCAVYPVRPFVCQLFGHVPELHCPRGYNVNIPEKRERKLLEAYAPSKADIFFLHSVVYSDDEVMMILLEGAA